MDYRQHWLVLVLVLVSVPVVVVVVVAAAAAETAVAVVVVVSISVPVVAVVGFWQGVVAGLRQRLKQPWHEGLQSVQMPVVAVSAAFASVFAVAADQDCTQQQLEQQPFVCPVEPFLLGKLVPWQKSPFLSVWPCCAWPLPQSLSPWTCSLLSSLEVSLLSDAAAAAAVAVVVVVASAAVASAAAAVASAAVAVVAVAVVAASAAVVVAAAVQPGEQLPAAAAVVVVSVAASRPATCRRQRSCLLTACLDCRSSSTQAREDVALLFFRCVRDRKDVRFASGHSH